MEIKKEKSQTRLHLSTSLGPRRFGYPNKSSSPGCKSYPELDEIVDIHILR